MKGWEVAEVRRGEVVEMRGNGGWGSRLSEGNEERKSMKTERK